MAVGTGAGIDVSALQRALSLLDTQLNGIITKSKAADASIKEMFRGNSGKVLNNQIRQIRDDVVALSKIKDPFIWDSGSLKAYIAQLDNLMNVVRVMNSTTGKTGFKRIIPINSAELAAAKKELMSMLKLVQSNEAALAAKTSARNQTYSGAMRYSSNASTLEQDRQAILNLTAAREKLKRSDAEYANKLERVNQAIRKHEKNIRDATRTSKERADQAQRDAKKIADAERRIAREQSQQRRQSYERYASSYDGATRISDKAFKRGSIEQEEKAVRRLEAARKKLSKTDADYEKKLANLNRRIQQHNKNIERAKQGAQSLNGAHTRLGRTAASLASRFAILWGVQLIRGFVNQLVEVRGEMELQQRALQAILQNKEKADEVWSKTIALAVKSPFQIKDLVTYTRQLAAYRIEADKLFDTNKMLADVSAGLGVDMSRLILAYGQVRAANYLRGTELRQFTEAGVPMLEELAKYFDEVKGKALSVGEVFQMVSKRMVSFADVEAVLKRMTSAGGVFYNMQEIQSQTLKGQVSNLKDAIQLMFNEIGEANDGTLKNTIGVLKSMVRNWRIIAAVIKTAGVTLATYFGSRAIGAIVVGIANIASGIRSTDAALRAMSTSNVITLILTAVAALGTALYQALNYTDALAASLANIELGAIKDIEDNIRLYQELAEASQDVTKSISERNTALNNLQDKFKDILPDQYTELQYIKSLSGEYKEVKQAMEDYYSSKAMQLKKTKIEEIYEKELQDTDIPELVNDYIDWASRQKQKGVLTDKDFHKVQVSINNIIQEIVQKAMEGEIDLSRPQNLSDAINKRLSEYIGKTIDMGATHNVMDLRMTLAKRASALRYLTSGLGKSFEEDMEIKNLQDIKARFQKAKEYYDEYVNILSDFVKGNITIEQLASEQQRVLANYKNDPLAVEGIAIQMENAFKELDNAVSVGEEFDFQKRIPEWKKSFLSAIYKDTISQEGLATTTNNFTNLLIEPLKDEIKALDTSDFQDTIVKVAEDIADKFDVDLDIFKEFIPQSKDTLDIIKQNVKSLIDSYTDSIREYNTAIEEAPQVDVEKILGITKSEVDKRTKAIPALKAFWHVLGGDSKDAKQGFNEDKKSVQSRIKLLNELYTEYKTAADKIGKIAAEQKIRTDYAAPFKTAFEGLMEFSEVDFTNNTGMVSALQRLLPQAQALGEEIKLTLEKEISKYQVEVDFDKRAIDTKTLKEKIQQLFDKYQLSIELRELRLPDDLVNKFIGLDALGLDTLEAEIKRMYIAMANALGDTDGIVSGQLQKDFSQIDWEEIKKILDKDATEALRSFLNDIDNLQEKQQRESAKRFTKFLVKNLDQTKVISTQLANDINYAFGQFKEGNIDAATFAETMKNAMEEAREETSKFNLDKFKKSPEYIMAMGDMSSYTTKELRDLLTTLEKVVAESSHLFSADEAKAYHDAIAKARKELEQQEKPLKMFGNVSKIAKILELEEKITKEKENQAKFEKDKKDKEAEINNIKGLLATAQEELQGMALDSPDLASQVLKVDGLKEQLKVAQASFQGIEGNLASSAANMSSMGAELSSMTGGGASFVAIIDAVVHGINNAVHGVKELVDEIAAVQESFGRETDMSTDIGKAAHIMGTFSKASQAATDAWDSLKSGDGMGVIVGVVKSWTEWIKGINAYKDAINEVSIAHHLEEVENLKDAYERLEWVIDQAFAYDRYGKVAEQQNNLTKQIENTYKAIALEEDKKDTDEDRLKELRKNIEDTTEQIEELFDGLREDLIGSYEDMGETLADAMVDALRSGEDALKAWGESVDEIVQGIVQKLLVQKYLEPRISDIVDEYYGNIMPKSANAEKAWENYLKAKERGDSKAANDYLAQFDKLTQQAIGETPKISQQATLDFANKLNDLGDEFLRLMPDWFKEMLTASSGGGLTALQKGIQGVTEQTAQVIESLLNSMRAYQADSNVELKNQTRILSNIYNILYNSTSGTQVAINTRLLK